MSSHHVVREAQEPALFIWSAEELAGDLLSQLLEWSPTLITREEALATVFEQGIKVDAVACTPDKEAELSRIAAAQPHIQLILASSDEEVLPAVLRYLASQGQQAMNVMATPSSERAYLLPFLAAQHYLPNVVVISGREKWSLYRNGSFTKWLPAGDEIIIQGVSPGLLITATGFATNMEEGVADFPLLLAAAESGIKQILAPGPFWLAEKLNSL